VIPGADESDVCGGKTRFFGLEEHEAESLPSTGSSQ
jgi:hypothetical protein